MTKLGWTLVGLTVIGGVALVIKESQAKAAGPELEGGFGPIPGGTPSLPSRRARFLVAVNARSAPRSTAALVERGANLNGRIVRVLETGIASAEPALSREWWRIVTPAGAEAFVSAVGPRGENNLQILET